MCIRDRVVGAQLQPGTEPRLLVIWCIVGELDAQMPSPGKADHEHRLVDARKVDGPHRATQHRLKAPSQFPAPVRAREDMRVAAKSDHDVTGPFPPDPGAIRSTLPLAVASSHKARSRRPVMPLGARIGHLLLVNALVCPGGCQARVPKALSCRSGAVRPPPRDLRQDVRVSRSHLRPRRQAGSARRHQLGRRE